MAEARFFSFGRGSEPRARKGRAAHLSLRDIEVNWEERRNQKLEIGK
jgi:hypothetical protein